MVGPIWKRTDLNLQLSPTSGLSAFSVNRVFLFLLLLLLLRGGLLHRLGNPVNMCFLWCLQWWRYLSSPPPQPFFIFCGLIFMIFIFCFVWFISTLPPQTKLHTQTHTAKRKRNTHIRQKESSYEQGWLSEQLGALENNASSLANYLSGCNSRGFPETLSEQAGGKEDKQKKKMLEISPGYFFLLQT